MREVPVRIFSRGMKQRLTIARALIADPKLLLFDEPYTGLDLSGCQLLNELLAEEKAKGRIILATTHEFEFVRQVADRFVILNKGRLVDDFEGGPQLSLDPARSPLSGHHRPPSRCRHCPLSPAGERMTQWLRAVKTLIWKDLVQEWRSRDVITAMFSFAVLSLFIFNYAMELAPANRNEISAGIIWVVMLFSGTLGLNRAFSAEQDQGCFDGLSLAVPDLSVIYVAKMLSNFLMMLFIVVLVVPLYSVLYNHSLFNPDFIGVLLLGALGYAAAGTLIAGMTVQTRMRDLLLPILLFPILMPPQHGRGQGRRWLP